jgi:hypothetical protein
MLSVSPCTQEAIRGTCHVSLLACVLRRRASTVTVPDGRIPAILVRLASHGVDGSGTLALCEVAAGSTGVSGASIMLLSDELARGSLCTTDGVAAYLDDLQFTLGEGPALDAHAHGLPVLVPDLDAYSSAQWPALVPLAVRAGVRAVFAFPLRIGAARLGAVTLLRDAPGPLDDMQYADAMALSVVASRTILALQADAPPGSVAAELERGANFHFVVHQAAGMVSVQIGIGVTEALVRLRAHAFLGERSIDDVSRDVVDRRLRLDGGRPGGPDDGSITTTNG